MGPCFRRDDVWRERIQKRLHLTPDARLARRIRIDIAPLEQIIEATDAVPAIAIGLEHQSVPAAVVGVAVVFGEQTERR